jgi:uncharacterized protein DUF4157
MKHRVARTPAQQPVEDPQISGGVPLDQRTRESVEPAFGMDFSRVRVHTDPRAAASAAAHHARAYTIGADITFAAGAYAPETAPGRKLLAHELAHVVQQERRAGPAVAAEATAESVADSVVSGRPIPAIGGAPAGTAQFQRDDQAEARAGIEQIKAEDLIVRAVAYLPALPAARIDFSVFSAEQLNELAEFLDQAKQAAGQVPSYQDPERTYQAVRDRLDAVRSAPVSAGPARRGRPAGDAGRRLIMFLLTVQEGRSAPFAGLGPPAAMLLGNDPADTTTMYRAAQAAGHIGNVASGIPRSGALSNLPPDPHHFGRPQTAEVRPERPRGSTAVPPESTVARPTAPASPSNGPGRAAPARRQTEPAVLPRGPVGGSGASPEAAAQRPAAPAAVPESLAPDQAPVRTARDFLTRRLEALLAETVADFVRDPEEMAKLVPPEIGYRAVPQFGGYVVEYGLAARIAKDPVLSRVIVHVPRAQQKVGTGDFRVREEFRDWSVQPWDVTTAKSARRKMATDGRDYDFLIYEVDWASLTLRLK